eukprot:SAG31_NODE_739_length_12444_cov_14.976831_3_plen_73_part_00
MRRRPTRTRVTMTSMRRWNPFGKEVLYTKLHNNVAINPRTMKSCGVWNAELKIIEFNDAEDEQLHEEQKAKQ